MPLADRNRKVVAAGVTGKIYLVQASKDLAHWLTMITNVVPVDSLITINDLAATNYPRRFYRLAAAQ